MPLDDDNLVDDADAVVEQPALEVTGDSTENDTTVEATVEAPLEIPDANWKVHGPKLWIALMQILGSKKTASDEGHKIEVAHDVMQQVNDTVAEVNQ